MKQRFRFTIDDLKRDARRRAFINYRKTYPLLPNSKELAHVMKNCNIVCQALGFHNSFMMFAGGVIKTDKDCGTVEDFIQVANDLSSVQLSAQWSPKPRAKKDDVISSFRAKITGIPERYSSYTELANDMHLAPEIVSIANKLDKFENCNSFYFVSTNRTTVTVGPGALMPHGETFAVVIDDLLALLLKAIQLEVVKANTPEAMAKSIRELNLKFDRYGELPTVQDNFKVEYINKQLRGISKEWSSPTGLIKK